VEEFYMMYELTLMPFLKCYRLQKQGIVLDRNRKCCYMIRSNYSEIMFVILKEPIIDENIVDEFMKNDDIKKKNRIVKGR
ncbi:34170_t:CDS:2, partial [Racocetra persica]